MTSRWILLAFLCGSAAGFAQEPPKLTTQKLTDRLSVIYGAGGNVAVGTGDTVFLVDDELQPIGPALKAEVAKLSSNPIGFVVNTHWHTDHTGGNALFGQGGAVIVAHDNVRKRLSTEQFIAMFGGRKIPPSPAIALPVITFADGLSLHLNGDDLQVQHIPAAHTDSDAIVWFLKDDVVHMGDTFFSVGYPFIDTGSGGRLDGYIAAAELVLARAKDGTKIIPGHGKVSDKKKLKTWRDMLVTVRDRIKQAVAQGKTLEQVQAMKPTAEFDAAYEGPFIKPAEFVESAYQSYASKTSR